MSRLAVRQDLQAVHRRRVRALGVGPLRPRTSELANVPRGSRKDVRDAVKAARKAAAGPGRRAPPTTAARSSTAPPRRSSRARADVAARERRPRSSDADRRARALRRLDRQAAGRCWAASTRSPRRSCPSRCPSRPAWWASSRPTSRELLGPRRRARARAGRRQHGGRRALRALAAARRSTSARCWASSDVPGGVVNLLSGRRDELAPGAGGPPRRSTRSSTPSGGSSLAAEIDELAAETVKRVRHAAPTASYARPPPTPSRRLEAVTELKTAWHPVGA